MSALDVALSLYLHINRIISRADIYLIKMMIKSRLYPYFLVTVQLACLFYILISGPIVSNSTAGLLIECAGIFLALLAIYVMKIKNFNLTPIVKQDSELITSGPYRIIRHPMYIAQLLVVLPLVIDYFSWYRFSALVLLAIILLVKIDYEEKLLLGHFTEYLEHIVFFVL